MITATMAEAKTHLSKLAKAANATGEPITVFRNSKPWIEIRPLAHQPEPEPEPIRFEDLPEETKRAFKEADEMRAHPERYPHFDTPEALFAELGL